MNFFGDLFNSLFGKKKKDQQPVSQPQRLTAQPSVVSQPAPVAAATPINSLTNRETQPNNTLNLTSLTSQLQKASPAKQELAQYTSQNQKNGVSEVDARNQAVKQYQKKYGVDPKNTDVMEFLGNTQKLASKASQNAKKGLNFWQGVTKAEDIAGNVPVVGALAKPVVQAIAYGANKLGINDVSQSATDLGRHVSLGLSDEDFQKLPKNQREKLGLLQGADVATAPLDLVGLGAIAKAPIVGGIKAGARDLIEGGVRTGLKDETKALLKAGAKAQAKQALIGAGIGGAGTAGVESWLSGKTNIGDIVHGATVGAGLGLLNPGGVLHKAETEVAPGIHSINPNREADIATSAIQEAQQAQQAAPPIPEVASAATPSIERVLPDGRPAHHGVLDQMVADGSSPDEIKQFIGTLPQEQQSEALQSVSGALTAPENNQPIPAVEPTISQITTQESVAPVITPQVQDGVQVVPETTQPTSEVPIGPTVPVAPRSHDALVKSLGPSIDEMKGKYSQREAVNLTDLKNNATRAIADMSDDEVLQSFATTGPDTMIRDSQSMSLARAALERLAKQPDNPAAVQTVTNILDALDRYKSKSGEALRVAQEEFDTMPLPMKVRYIAKKIDAANADTKGYVPLRDDVARASQIEQELTYRLQKSQNVADTVAQIEGKLQKVYEDAKSGVPTTENLGTLRSQLRDAKRNLAALNGETIKYFNELVPGRTRSQRALADFPRTMMLASFTGRVNDLATTAANVGHLTAQNITQGILSKAVNFMRPGTVTDTTKGFGRLFSGAVEGGKKTIGEVGGTQYAPDLETGLRGGVELRSGMQKAKGPLSRTVQAATEAATNLSEGVRDQRLLQLADQEAAKLGLKGELRSQYAEARSAVPSAQMLHDAEALHKEVNNLNENPITSGLNRVAAGIQGDSALGGLIKNQIVPFTSWLGGNIWNSITDKNVVANAVKIVDSARKGDAEGIVRNLAKLGNNAAQTYAVGYLLSQMGVITNENAEGYNDGGAYFHIGDRYIPVGFTGFFAPNIIMGNAVYNGLNNNNGANPAVVTAENVTSNLLKSINITGALGQDNNVSKAIEAWTRPGGTVGEAGAVAGAGAATQFLPGFFGDINAVLNNGIPGIAGTDVLNPTHEAADTKVINPNSPSGKAKDVSKSVVAQIVNRIPVASQLALPRKAGVAAADLVDRTTKGDRDTTTSKTARAEAKTEAQQQADFKARDIPDYRVKNFTDAVEARVENGEYGKAIEGLQAKLDSDRRNKDIPKSKLKDQEDVIARLQVAKDGKFGPNLIQQYKDTSLSEWRDMGDPDSDNYNPGIYQMLWDYDNALANKGVSRNNTSADKTFYSAKKPGKGRRGSSLRTPTTTNTIGSIPELGKVSFGRLAGKQVNTAPIPRVAKLKTGELVKKRKISVTKA